MPSQAMQNFDTTLEELEKVEAIRNQNPPTTREWIKWICGGLETEEEVIHVLRALALGLKMGLVEIPEELREVHCFLRGIEFARQLVQVEAARMFEPNGD